MDTNLLLQIVNFVATLVWVVAVSWLAGDLAGRAVVWWLERREKKRDQKRDEKEANDERQ